MKKKKKIGFTINKDLLIKLNQLTTNRSRLIEYILIEYLNKTGINTEDIIL